MNEIKPHAKHIYQMLLSNIVFLVHISLQSCEYVAFFNQIVTRPAFDVQHLVIGDAMLICCSTTTLGWNRKVFKLLPKNDYCLLGKQWVLGRGGTKLR